MSADHALLPWLAETQLTLRSSRSNPVLAEISIATANVPSGATLLTRNGASPLEVSLPRDCGPGAMSKLQQDPHPPTQHPKKTRR